MSETDTGFSGPCNAQQLACRMQASRQVQMLSLFHRWMYSAFKTARNEWLQHVLLQYCTAISCHNRVAIALIAGTRCNTNCTDGMNITRCGSEHLIGSLTACSASVEPSASLGQHGASDRCDHVGNSYVASC